MTLRRAALIALWSDGLPAGAIEEVASAFSLIMRNTGFDHRDAEAILRRVAPSVREPQRTQMLEEMKHAS